MKIMIMSQYYPPNYTAAGTRTYEMAKHLSSKDEVQQIDIVVWNPNFKKNKEKDESRFKLQKVTVQKIDIGKNKANFMFKYQDPNPVYAIVWLFLTAKFTKSKKPDIVFFSTPPGIMLSGAIWCRLFNIKYVIDYRDNWIKVNKNIIQQRKGLVRYIALILHDISHMLARFANKKAGFISSVHYKITDELNISREKVIEVRNGVDRHEIESVKPSYIHSSRGDKKYIAYVGNLQTPYYSPEVIIPTIKKNQDYHLLVFSTTTSRQFKYIISKSNLDARISMMGVEHKKMLSLLKGCDAGILVLQKNDTQGIYAIPSKFYDYISCGVPVLIIADRNTYVHKFVSKYCNGIALTWKELKKIEGATVLLVSNAKYRENAQKIIPMVLERYNRDKYNERLADKLIDSID